MRDLRYITVVRERAVGRGKNTRAHTRAQNKIGLESQAVRDSSYCTWCSSSSVPAREADENQPIRLGNLEMRRYMIHLHPNLLVLKPQKPSMQTAAPAA